MTPKEALEAIRKELQDRLDFPINLTPEYRLVKQSINELEDLKRYLARVFELTDKRYDLSTYAEDFEEMKTLEQKLRKKVGKEE